LHNVNTISVLYFILKLHKTEYVNSYVKDKLDVHWFKWQTLSTKLTITAF